MDEDDDEEEAERPTWVEALTQEITDDEAPEEDPDYEVCNETICPSSLYRALQWRVLFVAQQRRDGE